MPDVSHHRVAAPDVQSELASSLLTQGQVQDCPRAIGLGELYVARVARAARNRHINDDDDVSHAAEIGTGIKHDHIAWVWQFSRWDHGPSRQVPIRATGPERDCIAHI